jgi:predicted ATPase
MLAFFGAPVAHEDDPERAVRAALDMVAETDEFARQLKDAHGIDFRIRVGVNSGLVVVGNVGTDLRYEYTAIGDAMNVAARMQATAEPGTVVITAQTYRFLADAFDVEDLGEVVVKGKAEPVRAYRVVAPKAVPGRRRGLERMGLESPMVGRGGELATLRSLYEVVAAGRGRVAFLVGEPGIGKTRLMSELRRSLPARPGDGQPAPTWIEGRCVSYGQNLPYHLLHDLVRAALGSSAGGSTAERDELDQRLEALLGTESADMSVYLAHLLALPLRPDEADRGKLDPETLQGRYVAALHQVLRALAGAAPVVLVCEDLHWADPASVDVMRQLLPLAAQLPILTIAALRAETDSHGWQLLSEARGLFGQALTELRLQPLDEAASRDLVSNLLEIESLPEPVRASILARAEGNPFFVEEVVRMLIERGVIVRRVDRWVATAEVASVEIPETLHGLLLARIDQLPDEAKRSLRVASVIGRQFPVRVLERVLGDTAS